MLTHHLMDDNLRIAYDDTFHMCLNGMLTSGHMIDETMPPHIEVDVKDAFLRAAIDEEVLVPPPDEPDKPDKPSDDQTLVVVGKLSA